ncbi:MAG: acetate uptake transporter [Chitinophagaceae bacterium]
MSSTHTVTIVKDNTGNPAVLGLLCFGMTTVLLNVSGVGFFKLNSMILAMGIFTGGLAQVIAGIQEWKKNNTFGATAFTAYGMFWITFVGILLIPKTSFGAAFSPDAASMGVFLFMWGLFTLYMFFGTLKLNRMLQAVFSTLTVLFFLLAISAFTGSQLLGIFAGYVGIICGLSAIYGSAALVLNEVYGRTVLPLGETGTKSVSAEEIHSVVA